MSKLTAVEASGRGQSVWITGARVASALLAMAVPIVLVRVLSQSEFGVYKEIFLIAATALPVLDLGLPASLYYFIPRTERLGRDFHLQSLIFLTGAGLIGGGAVVAGGSLLERFVDPSLGPYLDWLALYVVFFVPGSLLGVAPMVDRRSRLAALALSGFEVVKSGLLVFAAYWTGTLEGVMVAACAGVLLKATGAAAYVAWRPAERDRDTSAALWRRLSNIQLSYALPFYGAALVGLIREKLHSYYVAVTFGSAQFAVYALATINIPILGRFSRTVGEVMVIETSDQMKRGRISEVRRTWWRATRILALVMIPCVANGVVFAPEMFKVVFGQNYVGAAPLFRVFVLVLLLEVIPASSVLRSGAELKMNAVADIGSLVVVVAVLVLLASPLGPMGAVLSLVAGRLTYNLMAIWRISERLGLGLTDFLEWRALMEMAVGSLMIAAVGRVLLKGLDVPAAVTLLVGGGVSAVGYTAFVWLRSLIPSQEQDLIRRLLAVPFDQSDRF